MTYTLTAEQMQQVREALDNIGAEASLMGDGATGDDIACFHKLYKMTYAALALLDAAMQAPEATAGGDVREAYKARRRMMSEDLTEAELRELENICHPVDDALDAQHAALATAPKPCEHGCQLGDGAIARLVTTGEPCPIHGTKPEAPTDATPKDEEPGR